MNKGIKIVACIYALIWSGWHVYSLDKNPLPWYDDTYYASVANSLLKSGQLIPTVVYSINDHQPVYHYGPIYFTLAALSFKFFGFGIFQFRLINLLFGIFLLIITYLLIYKLTNKWQLTLCAVILLSLDPFFGLCLHEGRMDIMVCSLALAAFYLQWTNGGHGAFYLSALLVGLGILTSSRAIFYVPAFAIYFLLDRKTYLSIFQWLMVAALPLLLWLSISFGSIDHLLTYMHHKNSQESVGYFFNLHWPLYLPIHSILLIIIFLIGFVLTVFIKPEALLENVVAFLISSILTYYILVVDYGPYSVMILPLYYCLFVYVVYNLGKWVVLISFAALFIFNGGYTGLKVLQVLDSMEMRNPSGLQHVLNASIPKGSKVVGDGVLYYVVESNGCAFQYIDHFGNDIALREKKLIDDFDFDYLILSDQYIQRSQADAAYLIQSRRYKEIARYQVKKTENIGFPLLSRLSIMENATGYNCTIFKRLK